MPFDSLLVLPKHLHPAHGAFHWTKRVSLAFARDADLPALALLATDLAAAGHAVSLLRSPVAEATVGIYRGAPDPAVKIPAEAYRIHVSKTRLDIHASADAGAFHAIKFLR